MTLDDGAVYTDVSYGDVVYTEVIKIEKDRVHLADGRILHMDNFPISHYVADAQGFDADLIPFEFTSIEFIDGCMRITP